MNHKDDLIRDLKRIFKKYGDHLPHEGRAWSRCLQCRVLRLIIDIRNKTVILSTVLEKEDKEEEKLCAICKAVPAPHAGLETCRKCGKHVCHFCRLHRGRSIVCQSCAPYDLV